MKKPIFYLVIALLFTVASCSNNDCCQSDNKTKELTACEANCKLSPKTGEKSCKLSSEEVRNRKATVLAHIKEVLIEKKELKNGYALKLPGNDAMLDELMDFIKSERQCCDFFVFNLSVNGDTAAVWLEIIGDEDAKVFMDGEMEF